MMECNNKGFSLIEVVVVVAISSFVLLMGFGLITNSSRMYNREDSIIDMQTEVQMITSNLTEAFMEATKLEINNGSDRTLVDLGNYAVDASGNLSFPDKNGYCRRIFFSQNNNFLGLIANSTYITEDAARLENELSTDETLRGYMLSECVKSFRVEIDSRCRAELTRLNRTDPANPVEETFIGYVNPLIVKVTYTLTSSAYDDDLTISIKLRNSLKEVYIDGSRYTVVDKAVTRTN